MYAKIHRALIAALVAAFHLACTAAGEESVTPAAAAQHDLEKQAEKNLNLRGPLYSFEEDQLPATWMVADGELSADSVRHQLGPRSLRWTWRTVSASLTCSAPDAFSNFQPSTPKRGGSTIAFWLHNDTPLDGILHLDLLNGDAVIGTCWYDLNYRGWRPLGADYTQLGWQPGQTVTAIRLRPPENIPSGAVSIDMFAFNAISTGPPQDWQQPWAGNPERLNRPPDSLRFRADDLTHNRPWLAEFAARQPTDAELAGLESLRRRLPQSAHRKASPAQISKWQQQLVDWQISRNGDIVSGIPIGTGVFMRPPNAIGIMPYFRTLNELSHCIDAGNPSVDQMYVDLVEHLLDQGWGMGASHIGDAGGGYDTRDIPPAIWRGRALLAKNDLADQAAAAVFWFMDGESVLAESPTTSTDSLLNINPHALDALIALPDEQAVRGIRMFARFLNSVLTRDDLLAADGTAYHHWMNHFAYASYSMPSPVRMTADLTRAGFRLKPEVYYRLGQYIEAHAFMSNQSDIPPNLNGRAGTGMSFNGAGLAAILADLGEPDGSAPLNRRMAALYLTESGNKPDDKLAARFRDAGITPLPLTGHWSLNGSAAALHRRDNWLIAMDGMRQDHRGFEIYGWLESNNYAYSTCNGSWFIYGSGSPVNARDSGFDLNGWDWCRWPGTTASIQPQQSIYSYYAMFGNNNWTAGGTTLDQDGIWGMQFNGRDKLSFLKSAFFFDNRVTVLTTDINCPQDNAINTTLFQLVRPKTDTAILLDGSPVDPFPCERTVADGRSHWLLDDRNTGYYLPAGNAPLHIRRDSQSWTYMTKAHLKNKEDDPHTKNGTSNSWRLKPLADNDQFYNPTTGDFSTAWLDHGAKVKDAAVACTMLIDTTPEKIAAYARDAEAGHPPDQILRRDNHVHLMRDLPSATTAAVVFTADTPLHAAPLLALSRPGFVMVRQTDSGLTVAIASTDGSLNSSGTPIIVTVAGTWILSENAPTDAPQITPTDDGNTRVSFRPRTYMPMTVRLRAP